MQGCIVWMICFFLLWGGGQNLYIALTNTSPTTVTLQEYCQKGSRATWLRLTNCQIDFTENLVAYPKYGDIADPDNEYYLPLFLPKEDTSKATAKVFLLVQNPEWRKLIHQMAVLTKKNAPEAEWEKFFLRHSTKIQQENVSVEGLVVFGIDADSRTRELLQKEYKRVDSDFIILKEGEKPSLLFGATLLTLGILLFFYLSLKALGEWDSGENEVEDSAEDEEEDGSLETA